LQQSIEELQSQQTILTHIHERLATQIQQGKNLKNTQADLLQQQELLKKGLLATKSMDPTKLTQKIQQLIDEQKKLEGQFDRPTIQQAIEAYKQANKSSLDGVLPKEKVTSLHTINTLIVALRNH
jgi:hypothetical protein